MNLLKPIPGIILALCLSCCATLQSTSIYSIPVSTVPQNATVKVADRKGEETIVTQSPDTLILKAGAGYFKRAEYLIEVSHKGYEVKKVPFYFVMDRKYINNIFLSFFMPVGFLLIDPVSGAMWEPEKQEIKVKLRIEN